MKLKLFEDFFRAVCLRTAPHPGPLPPRRGSGRPLLFSSSPLPIFAFGLAAVLLLTALAPRVHAQASAFWSGGTSTVATNRATLVVSPDRNLLGEGVFRTQYLNVTSDLATATCTFYKASLPARIASASSGTTNRVIFTSPAGTNFNTSNQVVLVRHMGPGVTLDTYDRLVSLTNTATTLTFTTATGSAVAVGDLVYILTPDTALFVGGVAQKEFTHAEGFHASQAARPLVVEVTGTTLAKILLLSGKWESQK